MTKQEDHELCMLLVKLLADINNESEYTSCNFSFIRTKKRVKAYFNFEVGEPYE